MRVDRRSIREKAVFERMQFFNYFYQANIARVTIGDS
jgi:hypothetical protein